MGVVLLALLQFLGWRIGSVARLECSHIRVTAQGMLVEASHCKTGGRKNLPTGKVSFT